MTEDEYKRTCHDELEWAEVEQLHAAILGISKNCFDYKKLCIFLLGIVATFLIKFSDNLASHLSFIIVLVLCVGFWGADSMAYYYQKSLRHLMTGKLNSIAQRNGADDYRSEKEKSLIKGAIFNGSMVLYYFLMFVILLGWGWFGYYSN